MKKKIFMPVLIALNTTLLILVFFHSQIEVPAWLQVGGRMHPMLLHLPIGALLLILFLRWFKDKLDLKSSSIIFERTFQITALLTVITAIAGCLLAAEESYTADSINPHRNTGSVLSVLTLLLCYFHLNEKVFKLMSVLAVSFLLITGHYGSAITHGNNFLLEPLKSKSTEKLAITDSSSVFEVALFPILEKKCNSCHNPSRKKGGLDMTTWESLVLGGDNGPVWSISDLKNSQLIQRIHLPIEDEEHMPPVEKQQLSELEKRLIELFIKAGPSRDITLGSKDLSDSLRFVARVIAKRQIPTEEIKIKRPFKAASPEQIKELNNASRTIRPLSADDPALRVGFYLSSNFKRSELEELKSIANQITELYLSGIPVKTEDLNVIENFNNLEVLFLNNTAIDDQSLTLLQNLPSLKKISISNTNVTEEGLLKLLEINTLQEISAWSTKADANQLKKLAESNPKIRWLLGETRDQQEILKLTPPMLVNENRILKPGEKIKIRHNLPGVTIRYSTNGEIDPDSVKGDIYTEPITPEKITRIKLRAVKEGWRMSTFAEATFFTGGNKPLSGKLLTAPAKDYRANGANTLIDTQAGDQENHRDGQWLGYKENPLTAIFEFDESFLPGSFTVSYLKNIGSYIMPPAKIKVYAGNAPDRLALITEHKSKQPTGYERNEVLGESFELNDHYRFIKITIEPIEKLPSWHGGKGQRGWIFIDEIFFYPKPTI